VLDIADKQQGPSEDAADSATGSSTAAARTAPPAPATLRDAPVDAPKQEAKTEAAAAPPAAAEPPKPKRAWKKKLVLSLVFLAALGGGSYYGHYYWTTGRFKVSTDDAYLGADMSIVSPKITGYVQTVPVKENDIVRAGAPLVIIDDGDFALALETAEAKIATQRAAIDRIASQRDAAEAQIGEAEASRNATSVDLAQAELDLSRASNLVTSGAGTKAGKDTAQSTRDSAAAKVAGADASITAAKANVAVLDAQRKEAERTVRELEIARDQAARDLTFTTIRAPYDGIVGNLAVQPGDLVSAGRRLAAIVPLDRTYIDANFKETQLRDLRPGQKVEIELDAVSGRKFEGTVDSLSPASGSVFSLLPSDNATGNFTKVVQRVPVRIAIDHESEFAGVFRPGLSAVVSVDIRTGPKTDTAAAGAPERTADVAAAAH
jgi:membrane fusion protein (multidrug efflux system)